MSGGAGGDGGKALLAWLEGREPRPPEAFRPWLEPRGSSLPAEGDGAGPGAAPLAALVGEATLALGDALSGTGERGGAFRLLAADAFLTYACEAALEREDPHGALVEIVDAVARKAKARDG